MASTKKCKYCQTEIPKKEKVCPQCRKRLKGGKFKWLLLIIIIICGVGYFGQNKSTKDIIEEGKKTFSETEKKDTKESVVTEKETQETEAVETEKATEKATESVSTNSNAGDLVDGMRPDVKEAIDNYEAFYNDYCDFMEKYSESDNAMEMLADYTEFMSKAATADEDMKGLEEDFNDAELAYFVDVSARIEVRLAKITISMN